MDKYTVDLDQVLNDFEYSELTDQHSKSVPEKPQGSVCAPPALVTKHSINNVFHSLNEYVNSGINSGSNGSGLRESLTLENPSSLISNDNNIYQEAFSEVEEHQNKTNKNIVDSLNNGFGSVNKEKQPAFEVPEHLPHIAKEVNKLNVDLKEKTNEYISSLNEEINEIGFKSCAPLAECSATEDKFKDLTQDDGESEILVDHIDIKDNTFEKTNGETIKTEVRNYSLLETENSESHVNCTANVTEKKSNNVNNESECDKNATDKADSALIEVKTDIETNESYFEPNLCEESVNKEEVVSLSNEKDDTVTNREDILVNIEEDNILGVSNNDNTENFVIEPSESPYAFGSDDFQVKQDACHGRDGRGNHSVVKEEENLSDKPISTSERGSEDCIKDTNRCENDFPIPKNTVEKEQSLNTEIPELKETENMSDDNISTRNPISIPEDPSEEKSETQQIIGFSADFDIDESELNEMLENLELEAEEAKVDISKEVVLGENKEDAATNETKSGESDCVAQVVENHETYLQIDSQVEPVKIKQLGPGTTLDNSNGDKSPEKSVEPIDEKPHQEILECLEIEKPKDIKESPESASMSGYRSSGSVATVQQLQEKSSNNEKEQESKSRPQNLPLNNELKDENVGRKINLIGSPGSTPYNNVYINKSIAPKTAHDTESDYTSSASPTFSDCSTESTSTASTVSVEDVPNNVDKLNNKSPRIKNTNVESESRESVQNQNTTSIGEDSSNVQDSASTDQANIRTVEASDDIPDEAAANVAQSMSGNGAGDTQVETSQSSGTFLDKSWLGKEAPLWIPDADAPSCLHCDMKFTVLKRRHHCRACGLVLCSKCCNLKFRLEYLDAEARVCNKCYNILNKDSPNNAEPGHNSPESGNSPAFRPNPNNPLEYCSTVSPLQQAGQAGAPPPSVMVPVGVLKRKGSNKKTNKSVMFCDGIAPGSDLTHLDQDFNYNSDSKTQKPSPKVTEEVKKEEPPPPPAAVPAIKVSRNQPKIDEDTGCFIPKNETSLPPTISVNKTDILYSDCSNSPSVVEMLKNEVLVFAITQNLFVHVKVINMSCCINKQAWCFSSEGLINVGSDEVVYLIEYIDEESFVPKDVFFHIYSVYTNAVKGTSIKELGLSLHNTSNFLDSKNHAGFVYIKPSFQCLENVILPKEPYLIGILIHRWETPWAKLFPLRLVLRLGAEYRYYPSPLISTRHRDSVFVEIGHTIINLLADFRNFTYTLPQIRGLIIHMEDKKTTITIPKNRYDQVMKSINNSSEHILAFAGNFSPDADSHLVCIQDTQGHENCYTTHAINIHNKPRRITGASFIVFNGSLKSSSGLTAKSNIVEDGLMIQVPSEHMEKIRDNLRNMKNHTIACGCINTTSDESVNIVWGENDIDFNAGVRSPVDNSDMKGVPSIRVHNGKDYFCNNGTRLIRWTEVFILQNEEESQKNQDPVDISKVSESIAKACCNALVKYLDLLVSNSCQKIGIRTTLHVENVSYSAGSNGLKLPPIYMRSLDDELVPVLHRITSNNLGDNAIVLELIFRILNA